MTTNHSYNQNDCEPKIFFLTAHNYSNKYNAALSGEQRQPPSLNPYTLNTKTDLSRVRQAL
ncbi:hypothetical protein EG336_25900 [Vibrio parahaemolyticus]|nr:hypothetical protein [Vibrio parahaemolyticus]